jgi:hypothetical protein
MAGLAVEPALAPGWGLSWLVRCVGRPDCEGGVNLPPGAELLAADVSRRLRGGDRAEAALAQEQVVLAAFSVATGCSWCCGRADRGCLHVWLHDVDQLTGEGFDEEDSKSFPLQSEDKRGNATT